MTQKIFNEKFKELYKAYSSNSYNENEQLKLLKSTLFYNRNDEFMADELKTLHDILLLHTNNSTKLSFFLVFRRTYNIHTWIADPMNGITEEEYNYLCMRDTNVLVLFYMFATYSLRVNPFDVPISSRHTYRRAEGLQEDLIKDKQNHTDDTLFNLLKNVIPPEMT